MKKIVQMRLGYLVCLIFFAACMQASEIQSFDEDQEDDIFASISDAAINRPTRAPLDQEKLTPDDIISCVAILNELGVVTLLEEPIYLHTNVWGQRSLHDLPTIQLYGCDVFRIELFYNQTSREYFTQDSDTVESYLALTRENLLRKLQDVEKKISEIFKINFNVNIPQTLCLFRNIIGEERRLGLMLRTMKDFDGKFILRLNIPIYYLERNFNLSSQDRRALENAQIPGLSAPDPDQPSAACPGRQTDAMEFAKKHLVADRFGLGDTRIYVDFHPIDNERMFLDTGLFATLPTAFALRRGIIGGRFEKNNCKPPFDICELIKLGTLSMGSTDQENNNNQQRVTDMASEFFIAVLDKFSANLLDTGLGNNGHVGLGYFIEPTFFVNDTTFWRIRLALEYLFPAREKRFFLNTILPSQFANRDFNNPDKAPENLAFINQKLIDQFFPNFFDTLVEPGLLFRYTQLTSFDFKECWNLVLGGDIWWQQKESLSDIKNTCNASINVAQATRSQAFQAVAFGAIRYIKNRSDHDLLVSLSGDVGLYNAGIGSDVTLWLGFELSY